MLSSDFCFDIARSEAESVNAKWKYLEHKGPFFPKEHERLPQHVNFYYDGKSMVLSKDAEELAYYYGSLLNYEHASYDTFKTNFMTGWQSVSTNLKGLELCSSVYIIRWEYHNPAHYESINQLRKVFKIILMNS